MKINVVYIPQVDEIGVRRGDAWNLILDYVRKVDNGQYPEAYDCD